MTIVVVGKFGCYRRLSSVEHVFYMYDLTTYQVAVDRVECLDIITRIRNRAWLRVQRLRTECHRAALYTQNTHGSVR